MNLLNLNQFNHLKEYGLWFVSSRKGLAASAHLYRNVLPVGDRRQQRSGASKSCVK
jgi:hypothetical protein